MKTILTQPTAGEWFALREGVELQGSDTHEVATMIGDLPVSLASVPISSSHGAMEPDGKGGSREYESYTVSEAESLANLHLFAAAKKLLAMVKNMKPFVMGYSPDHEETLLTEIDAVIAEAEGRS